MATAIRYVETLDGIKPKMLTGFFEGWQRPPSVEGHLQILKGSDRVVLAIDEQADRVVGHVTALTDGFQAAFISLLEVVGEYRGRGIGRELMQRMLGQLADIACIDLTCETPMQRFYEKFDMAKSIGMVIRDYDRMHETA